MVDKTLASSALVFKCFGTNTGKSKDDDKKDDDD
jgi:hypothetical protein